MRSDGAIAAHPDPRVRADRVAEGKDDEQRRSALRTKLDSDDEIYIERSLCFGHYIRAKALADDYSPSIVQHLRIRKI